MTQYARPDGVILLSNWTGSNTDIDEVTASDADYIIGAKAANGTAEFSLSNVTDPVSSVDHILKFRTRQSAAPPYDRYCQALLYQGTTLKASSATITLGATWQDITLTLSTSEADSITDYNDLRIRFVSTGKVSPKIADQKEVWVSWAVLEVPDVVSGPTYTLTCAKGSYSLTGENVLLSTSRKLQLAKGSYSLTGENLVLSFSRKLQVAKGSYSLTGENVLLSTSRKLELAKGSYSLTGENLSLSASRKLELAKGSYSLTGENLLLSASRKLQLDKAAFVLDGRTINLEYTQAQLEVLDIDHETGDTSQWTSIQGGTDVTVTPQAALVGSNYGLQVLVNDTGNVFGRYDYPVALTPGVVSARFYLNLDNLSMADTTSFYPFAISGAGGITDFLVSIYIRKLGATLNIQAIMFSDSGYVYTAGTNISSGTHCIEIFLQRASDVGVEDGVLTLYIDGLLQQPGDSVIGKNYFRFEDLLTITLGAWYPVANVSGTIYADELVVNYDGSYIGPIAATYTLTCDKGSYSLTGENVLLSTSRKLQLAKGSYSLTGENLVLSFSRKLQVAKGSYSLTGENLTLGFTRQLQISKGSYSLTGENVLLSTSRKLQIAKGSYSLTGENVLLSTSRKLQIAKGSYSLTGRLVDLVYTPLWGPTYTLICTKGSYSLTGENLLLSVNRKLQIVKGSYSLTGENLFLSTSRKLQVTKGLYSLTGENLLLSVSRKLQIDKGSYSLTGENLVLLFTRKLQLDKGSYFFFGNELIFLYTPIPPEFDHVLICQKGNYILLGLGSTICKVKKIGGLCDRPAKLENIHSREVKILTKRIRELVLDPRKENIN